MTENASYSDKHVSSWKCTFCVVMTLVNVNPTILEECQLCRLVDHEKNGLCDGYIVEFIHYLLKIIMRVEYMLVGVAIISSFHSMCWKVWSYPCFTFVCKLIIVPTSCFITKSLCIGSGLDLNVLLICFMMLSLCFNSYPLCEHHWNHHA